MLEFTSLEGKPSAPFKHNSLWDEEEELWNLICDHWTHFQENNSASTSYQFVSTLRLLKEKISTCDGNHRRALDLDLQNTKSEPESL
jgi:hypothetical protein